MSTYYKFAILVIRLVSVLVVLYEAYAILLGGVTLSSIAVGILPPLAFAIFLWLAAPAIAKIVSSGIE